MAMRRMPSRFVRLALVSGALAPIVAVLLPVTTVHATCFSGEQTIFAAPYGIIDDAKGVTNWFKVRARALDSGCSGSATHSTAQLGSPTALKQVEIGWTHQASGHIIMFWEAQNGSISWGGANFGDDITSAAGEFWGWRVSYHGDDTRFHVYYNNGQGFEEFIPCCGWSLGIPSSSVGFTQGWPKGETGRWGGTGTSATDRHYNLTYRPCSVGACWDPWPSNSVPPVQDNISGWHHHYDTADAYDIVKD